MGVLSLLGQQSVPSGVCVSAGSFQWERERGGGCTGAYHRRSWSGCSCGVGTRGPHSLVEAYVNFLGSGYQQKLIEYPLFDLRLFKRCLQKTASRVFGTLDPYSMTEFIVTRLKGADSRDWMASRPALKKAILTSRLAMPELVDVVANIVGVWPLIVAFLKETGRKDDGDSLVV